MEQTHTTERRTLLRQSLAIVRAYQDTWDTLEAANKAHPLPAPLGRAFTLEELEAYEAALAQRTHALTPLEAAWKETDRAKQHHIGALLRAGMPPERWIRDGEWVIGMSYSNGGGHSYDLHCLPAQTQPLPSLNRRYTGDEQRGGASNDTHGKGHTLKVQFSDIDEFFTELERDADPRLAGVGKGVLFNSVELNLLRVTKQYQPTAQSPIVYLLQVVAGAIVHGQLIELTHTLGDVILGRDPQTPPPIEQRADALVTDITARAEALGLEVRAGRFMP